MNHQRTGPAEAAGPAGMDAAPGMQGSLLAPGMVPELWLGTGQVQELWQGLHPAGGERMPWGVVEQVGQAFGDLSCSHWAGWT